MSNKDLMTVAKDAAQYAKKAGADDARISMTRSRDVSVEWRDGKLDRIQENTKQSLTITLFVDGRYSVNSTSDLRPEAVEKYIANGVLATKYLAEDPHRHLPDPARYEGMISKDLGIYDTQIPTVSPKSRLDTAKALEEASRTGEGSDRIISVTSAVSDYEYESVCIATNGLEASEIGTSTWRSASVSIRDEGDRKPRGGSYGGGTHLTDLPDPATIGPDALKRAVEQLGSKQVPTDTYTVVVENRAAPTLSRHLFSALSGGALQQKASFLEGMRGKSVATKRLSVISDPHLKGGLSSTAWDSEGMATRQRPVFESGVLKTYFLDTYYASKLDMVPTSGSAANLVWQGGDRDAQAIIKSVKKGIFVTSFLGGNSNGTTGDFSLGIKGFYIEEGRIAHPVSEMNMAGNHLILWKQLAQVGNDPWPYSSNRTPTLVFEKVQCSGSKA